MRKAKKPVLLLMGLSLFWALSFASLAQAQSENDYEYVKKKVNVKMVDAALAWDNNIVFFFSGSQYLRYDAGGKTKTNPRPIKGNWPGVWESGIDAALHWGGGFYYFFKGNQYVCWNAKANKALAPKPIKGNWPGVWESGIDAACNYGSDWILFIKGSEYLYYNTKTAKALAPKPIKGNWPGVWENGIDAMACYRGFIYFFKGEEYISYEIKTKKAGAPKSIEKEWNVNLPLISKEVSQKVLKKNPLPEAPARAAKSYVMVKGIDSFFNCFEYDGAFVKKDIHRAIYENLNNSLNKEASHQAGHFWKRLPPGKTLVIYWYNKDYKTMDWMVAKNGQEYWICMDSSGKVVYLREGESQEKKGSALGVNYTLKFQNPENKAYWKNDDICFWFIAE